MTHLFKLQDQFFIIFLLFVGLIHPNKAVSENYYIHVGDHEIITCEEAHGSISWTSVTKSNFVWTSGTSYAGRVYISQYFDGYAIVKCTWKWFDNNVLKTDSKEYYVYCKKSTLKLKDTELDLELTSSYDMEYTTEPSGLELFMIDWKSSNKSVATVNEDGWVNAVGEGTCVITADGHTGNPPATCTVTVADNYWVKADVKSGIVAKGTKVSLTCTKEGGVIFFTTDGSEPTKNSTQYTAPIVINNNVTIKAKAWVGSKSSKVTTLEYSAPAYMPGTIISYTTIEGVKLSLIAVESSSSVFWKVSSGKENTTAIDPNYTGGVTIPKTVEDIDVKSIDSYAFKKCKLSAVTFPNTALIFYINPYAFQGCYNLKSVEFPLQTRLYTGAFRDCESLEKIVFKGIVFFGKNSTNSREDEVFYNCNNIKTITNEWTSAGEFKDNTFTQSVYNNAILYVPFDRVSHFKGLQGWRNFKNIKEIGEFPNTDGEIFTEKTKEGVEMKFQVISASKKTCKVYGELAGEVTGNNKGELAIDENIKGTVTIPESVKGYTVIGIGESAFYGCAGITSFTLPNTITYIGESAFNKCTGITSIVLPSSLETIGPYSFYDCDKLQSIDIPSSVLYIRDFSFSNCTSLTSASISDGVISILDFAFAYCSRLTKINIPRSVTFVRNPFAFSTNLTSITVDKNNAIYDSRDNCNAIIEKATNKLVVGCRSTEIPYSVTCIGDRSFLGQSTLASITIPKSVESIEGYAFYRCDGLDKVITQVEEPFAIEESAFSNYDSSTKIRFFTNATLYVPKGTKTKYQQTDGWKKFSKIVEIDGTLPKLLVTATPSGREVNSGTTVKLSVKTATEPTVSDATIYYTLNGSYPSTSSTKYTSSGITISRDCTLNAIAYKDGYETSDVYTAEYTIKSSPKDEAYYYVGGLNGWNIADKSYPFQRLSDSKTWELTMTTKISDIFVVSTSNSDWDTALRRSTGQYSGKMVQDYQGRNFEVEANQGMISYTIRIVPSTMYYEITRNSEAESYYYVGTLNGWEITNKNYPFSKQSDGKTWRLTMSTTESDEFKIAIGSTTTWDNVYGVSFENDEAAKSGSMTIDNYSGCPNFKVLTEFGMYSYTISIVPSTMRYEIVVNKNTPTPTSRTVTLSSAGYATFYDSQAAYTLPNGLAAQVVTGVSNGKLVYKTIADGSVSGVVPKGTAVMLKSDSQHSGSYTLTSTNSSVTYSGTNLLRGNDETTTTTGDGYHYKLTYGNAGSSLSDVFGWYWGASNGGSFRIDGHKVWLVLPKSTGTRAYTIDGNPTAIDVMEAADILSENPLYDLQGRRVSPPQTRKGLYIQNGKKVIKK